jgi:predicted nucleic acid-binding protein
VRQYTDFPPGTADASMIAVAERLGSSHVATIDHRHFRIVRSAHCAAFGLLPAL